MTKFLIISCFSCLNLLAQQKENLKTHQSVGLTAEERAFLVGQLEKSRAKFDSSVAHLTTQQTNFRASEGKWTIAECIEHITLAELSFMKIVTTEMAKPAEPERRKEIKINDARIIKQLTNRRGKANSPEKLKPTGTYADATTAIKVFQSERINTINYVNTTNDDLRNHFWKHMATGVIDLYQTLIVLSAHLERHVAQIEEVKSAKNFPQTALQTK